ncbi:MAG: DUF1638 domain-containing protein [Gammaproteobacteria bacterium]|nr:DUF1638 domain-containing protein [Gammaproteobacteria bacterium]MDE0367726.1 DUF1638 domain-containing protein [Gammaproteobacteria bacterium]
MNTHARIAEFGRCAEAPVGDAETSTEPVLVISCGALARELHAIRQANGWDHLHIRCIDARLHHRPSLIPERLRKEIARARTGYRRVFVAYADCGTYGEIDRILAAEPGIERLPGLHCYEFFAGAPEFGRLSEEEPGTFYLTDFLARFFDRFVMGALMLDRHPELIESFFGNYRRIVYLSQTLDDGLLAAARRAAETLNLEFHHVHCGYGALEAEVAAFARGERSGSGAEDRVICRSAA